MEIPATSARERWADVLDAVGADTWHIRAARDRHVVYEIHDRVPLVTVVDVGHRGDIHR